MKISKAQESMKKVHTKRIDKLNDERVEGIVACNAVAPKSQETSARELNDAVSHASLKTAECDRATQSIMAC